MDDSGYNSTNEYANDTWEKEVAGEDLTGKVVEKIDKTKLVEITNSACTHENQSKRPATEFDGSIIEVTCNDCPWGTFIRS